MGHKNRLLLRGEMGGCKWPVTEVAFFLLCLFGFILHCPSSRPSSSPLSTVSRCCPSRQSHFLSIAGVIDKRCREWVKREESGRSAGVYFSLRVLCLVALIGFGTPQGLFEGVCLGADSFLASSVLVRSVCQSFSIRNPTTETLYCSPLSPLALNPRSSTCSADSKKKKKKNKKEIVFKMEIDK